MSGRERVDVLVVGGAVVGAAAALALAREGFETGLVEAREPARWDVARPDLRVYALAPDNARFLADLGIWEAVREARAQPYRRMRVWDAGGGGALEFDADALAEPQLGWIVEHGLLVDRLWAALPHAGVRVWSPAEVRSLEMHEGHVDAHLEGEAPGSVRARLLVGADGAASRVRGLAGIDAAARDYRQRGLVAFVESERPHQATCLQRFLPGGPLAFLPFAGGMREGHRHSIVWTLPDGEAERLRDCAEAEFADALLRASAGILGALSPVSARAAFPLRRLLAGTQARGRVALVGDAAHVVHPLAGQGVNLGLRDVATLQAALRRGRESGHDPASTALVRWSRRRRSENAVASAVFDGINRVFSNDDVALTLLRGPLMGLGARVPGVPAALARWATGLA